MVRLVNAKGVFSSGEISRELYGRIDFRRHQTGLALCQNFVVMPAGALTRRPPTQYMAQAYADSVLLAHEIRRNDNYVIELGGHGAMRFWRMGGIVEDGGNIYEVSHGYQTSDLYGINYVTSGDVIYLTHPTSGMKTFSRYSNVNWVVEENYNFKSGPFLDENQDENLTIHVSASEGSGVTLTPTGFTFDAAHVGSLWKFREFDGSSIGAWLENKSGHTAGQLVVHGENVYAADIVDGTNSGVVPPTHTEGKVSAGENLVKWEFVRKDFGIAKITSVDVGGATALADVELHIPNEYTLAGGSQYWAEGSFSGARGWPKVLSIHQERFIAAADLHINWSAISDYSKFYPGTDPDEAFNYRIGSSSRSANDVSWIESGKVLAVGTSGEEFVVRAPDGGGISSTNLDVKRVGAVGSGVAGAIGIGSTFLQIGASERETHQLSYNFQDDEFKPTDISLQSRHLLSGGVKKIRYQKAPYRIAWHLRYDGKLSALTYMPDQEVIAWHHHPIDGIVEDIEVMPSDDGSYDELWLIVRRGDDRSIERLDKFFDFYEDQLIDRPFLDCYYTYEGVEVSTIPVPDFYNGREVDILTSDGLVQKSYVVANSQVTLTKPFSKLTIGFLFESRARLLPAAPQLRDGTSDGRVRHADNAVVRVMGGPGALIGEYGLDEDQSFEKITELDGVFDEAPTLLNEIKEHPIPSSWSREGYVDVVMGEPFAFSLLAVHLEMEVVE